MIAPGGLESAAVFVAIFVPMIAEAVVSARHERALRAMGAVEPRGDVYKAMQIAYPACFLAMIAEGLLRRVGWDAWSAAGCVVFAAAKALKYWAIASLGARWTFRVLVPPGSVRTVRGPYRWLQHPNYVAVGGELIAAALATHAAVTGVPVVAGFAWLMGRRIGVEERALGEGRIAR